MSKTKLYFLRFFQITLLILCLLLMMGGFPTTQQSLGGLPHYLFYGTQWGIILIVVNVIIISVIGWM